MKKVNEEQKSKSDTVNVGTPMYSEVFKDNLSNSIEHFYLCGKSGASDKKRYSDKPFAYVNMS